MAKKYYVIWKGLKTGVFDNWPQTLSYTQGRADAQYMGFPSKADAEKAFADTYTKALMQRSLSKGKSSSVKTASSPGLSASKSTNADPQNNAINATTQADLHIYCDGACSPNPGKSGTGMAVYNKGELIALHYGLYQPNGTNNTAELNGMLEAFKYAQDALAQQQHVQILSDSKYSIDCITKWAQGWKKKGWTRGKGEEIKNLDIIKQCFELYQRYKNLLIIRHVKGHANIEGNELSDRMAVYARSQQQQSFIAYTDTLDIPTILAMKSG